MRGLLSLPLVLLTLAACGGDATGPKEPTFPEIAGTYDYSAPISEIPGARISGEFSLADDSRETPTFSGSFSYKIIGPDGANYGTGSGSIVNGTVTEAGLIEMDFGNTSFHLGGTVAGRNITGNWLLRGAGGENFSGTFTATRR